MANPGADRADPLHDSRPANPVSAMPAAIRGADSFFADAPSSARATRVCHGTSCLLAGADELHRLLAPEGDGVRVYCLGHCDRSPAALRPDGSLLAREDGARELRSLVAEPIVLERVLVGAHAELGRARQAGVWETLAAALRRSPEAVLELVERSGLRGRGGAGFPVGAKWRACAQTPAAIRVVVANGDEGDPGSFVDRVLMEQDPHALLEGMALCAYAVGARLGVVYVRSEYPRAAAVVEQAIVEARAAGLLGEEIGGAFSFDVQLVRGRGSYVCGEETALLNAIEGRRGEVRLRPPYPAQAGLFGRPTVVQNVETLVTVPWLMRHGAEAFRARGTAASPGTKVLSLNRGFARPGLVEVAFGTPLQTVIDEAGGAAEGELAAVLLGGPMGCVVRPAEWAAPLCYQALAERGLQLGHGGLVALPHGADARRLLRHWLEFMAEESCGKCVPCRLGSQRAVELVSGPEIPLRELRRWLDVMADGSLCAFGQLIPEAVRQLIDLFESELVGAGEGRR